MGVPLMGAPGGGGEHTSLVARYLRDVFSRGTPARIVGEERYSKRLVSAGPKGLRERSVQVKAMKKVSVPFEERDFLIGRKVA